MKQTDDEAWVEQEAKYRSRFPRLSDNELITMRESFLSAQKEEREKKRADLHNRVIAYIALFVALLALLQDYLKT
jgi:hypothetical protein